MIVWHVPPRGDKPVVLYFHGNGGSLAWRVERFRRLTADGTGLVALSYRGYGGSSGSPTEAGLIADALAAYAFAAARYPAARIALWANRSAAAWRSRSPPKADLAPGPEIAFHLGGRRRRQTSTGSCRCGS